MKTCDFSRSYLRWSINDPSEANTVRIQFDARAEILDDRTGRREEFLLITSCKSERMYVPRKMWQDPNYDFCGIWSARQCRIFRTWASIPTEYAAGRTDGVVQALEERFKDVALEVRHFRKTRRLRNARDVITASRGGEPIVAFTELRDARRKRTAVLEYPIKTMNFVEQRSMFQVDTGPLLYADLGSTAKFPIAWLTPAFIVYNTFDYAEFVLRAPTPVGKGVRVMHYSKLIARNVRTTLMACA